MGRESGTSDADSLVWVPVPLSLGASGVDLRRQDQPEVLAELLNARFVDGATIERRDGHTGRALQSYSSFELHKHTTDRWVYGHGTVVEVDGNSGWENARHPVHVKGQGGFDLDGVVVVWTGDRLLIVTEDGPMHGASQHWDRGV